MPSFTCGIKMPDKALRKSAGLVELLQVVARISAFSSLGCQVGYILKLSYQQIKHMGKNKDQYK